MGLAIDDAMCQMSKDRVGEGSSRCFEDSKSSMFQSVRCESEICTRHMGFLPSKLGRFQKPAMCFEILNV